MVEKSGLPLRLVVQTLRHRLLKVRAGLPFLAGDGKQNAGGLFCDFLPVKSHHGIFTAVEDIDGHILVDQLRRPVSGQGQEVSIQIAAPLQILRRQVRVRHGVFVQHRLRRVRHIIAVQHMIHQFFIVGDSRCRRFKLCLLQGLHHIQRNRLRVARMLALHRTNDMTGRFQRLLRGTLRVLIVKLPAVHEAHGLFIIKSVVNTGVGKLNMEIGGIVYQVQSLIRFLRLFRLAGGGGLRRGPVPAAQLPDGVGGDGLFLQSLLQLRTSRLIPGKNNFVIPESILRLPGGFQVETVNTAVRDIRLYLIGQSRVPLAAQIVQPPPQFTDGKRISLSGEFVQECKGAGKVAVAQSA